MILTKRRVVLEKCPPKRVNLPKGGYVGHTANLRILWWTNRLTDKQVSKRKSTCNISIFLKWTVHTAQPCGWTPIFPHRSFVWKKATIWNCLQSLTEDDQKWPLFHYGLADTSESDVFPETSASIYCRTFNSSSLVCLACTKIVFLGHCRKITRVIIYCIIQHLHCNAMSNLLMWVTLLRCDRAA